MPLPAQEQKVLHVLGFLFLRMGQAARAKRLFSALVALNAEDYYARCALALSCIQLDDGETALHALSGISPDAPLPGGPQTYHILLARAYRLTGNTQEAREEIAAFWRSKQREGSLK
ncbi:MAG: hypothetical protein IJU76_00495 [Desulfovibrionaceae bacterium]|nr:hypothetical protein [Desulfovibrionaceae bacterium]